MTKRKPPGVPWDTWIEKAIEKAREEGKFDQLPGSGRPLPGVGKRYDPDWWTKQLMEREQLSLLPPALELRRRAEQELARIRGLARVEDVRVALEALNAEIVRTNRLAHAGPPTHIAAIDIASFVESWQAARVAAD